MKSPRFFLILVLLFLSQLTVHAQNFNDLDEVRNYALDNSSKYKRALLDVLIARKNLDGVMQVDKTSFSFNGDYRQSPGDTAGSGNVDDWLATAGINLPLLDQLAVSASISDDYSGQLGFIFSPLFHSDDRKQLTINYKKALLYAEEVATQTENEALSALLNWMIARRQMDLQQEIAAVKEDVYKDRKVRYQAGESTLDDVRDDLVAWTEARAKLSAAQTFLQAGESILLQKLSADLDTAGINIIPYELIQQVLEDLKKEINPEEADSSGVYSVAAAYKAVESSEEKLADTWIFDPSLNLTGKVNLPDMTDFETEGPNWELGIQLSFSLDDFNKDERSINNQEVQLSRLEAIQADMESRLTLQQAISTLGNTEQNRILAELEEEQSGELYDEAQFLFDMGEYSEAELEDARLVYEQSLLNTYSMVVEEYLAWRDLLLYF